MRCLLFIAITILFSTCSAQEVIVKVPSGEMIRMEIEPSDTFNSVLEQIEAYMEIPAEYRELYARQSSSASTNRSFTLDYSEESWQQRAVKSNRNYDAEVTPSEKEDMSYIAKTLARNSLISIYSQRKDLERAGERYDHVHPFRFLMTLFEDEELKVCVRMINNRRDLGRRDIWNEFVGGFNKSFTTEVANSNVDQHVDKFAARLGLKGDQIRPIINQRDWEGLITTLIELLPRTGDSGRYDM
jgi:hypothetical protein